MTVMFLLELRGSVFSCLSLIWPDLSQRHKASLKYGKQWKDTLNFIIWQPIILAWKLYYFLRFSKSVLNILSLLSLHNGQPDNATTYFTIKKYRESSFLSDPGHAKNIIVRTSDK